MNFKRTVFYSAFFNYQETPHVSGRHFVFLARWNAEMNGIHFYQIPKGYGKLNS